MECYWKGTKQMSSKELKSLKSKLKKITKIMNLPEDVDIERVVIEIKNLKECCKDASKTERKFTKSQLKISEALFGDKYIPTNFEVEAVLEISIMKQSCEKHIKFKELCRLSAGKEMFSALSLLSGVNSNDFPKLAPAINNRH